MKEPYYDLQVLQNERFIAMKAVPSTVTCKEPVAKQKSSQPDFIHSCCQMSHVWFTRQGSPSHNRKYRLLKEHKKKSESFFKRPSAFILGSYHNDYQHFFAWVFSLQIYFMLSIAWGHGLVSHSSMNFFYSKFSFFLCILPGQLLPLQRCTIVYLTTVMMRDTSIAIRFFFFIIMKDGVGCREICRSLMTESTYTYLFFFSHFDIYC